MSEMRRFFRIPFVRTPKRRLTNDVTDELEFHLDTRVERLVAEGWEPSAARREARRQFGDVESVRDDCVALDIEREKSARWTDFLDDLRQDIRYAVHALRRTPGWTSVAIFTLALGVGANTAVFTVVNGVLLRPLPFRDSGQLMLVSYDQRQPKFDDPSMLDSHYLAFRKENRSFEDEASFNSNEVNVTGAGDAARIGRASVTPEFFSVFEAEPELGRTFTHDEGRAGSDHIVVISDRIWRGRFGADRNILQRSLRIEDEPYSIIGVMPASFDFPIGQDLWVPTEVRVPHEPWHEMTPVVGRLRKDVTAPQARAELENMAHTFTMAQWDLEHGVKQSDYVARVLPLRELMVRDARRSLVIFASAVAFVLLIACVNVANLVLMRTVSRAQEIAVRRSLGAGRGRLIRQLLTESSVLWLSGAIVGMAFAVVGERALLSLAPEGTIPLADNIRLDWRVLAITLLVALLCGLVFGLAPALRATKRPLRESLSHGTRVASEGGVLLRTLAVAEIALALVLLTCAGLMIRSFARLRAVDLGFHPENVATMSLIPVKGKYDSEAKLRNIRDRVIEALRQLPQPITVGAINFPPLGYAGLWWRLTAEGSAVEEREIVTAGISGDYFRAIGIPVLSGRTFTNADDASAPGVVIVSRLLASKEWPNQPAVGKRISMPDLPAPPSFLKKAGSRSDSSSGDHPRAKLQRWLTVVGVVGDVVQENLTDAPSATIYLPLEQIGQTLTFHPEMPGSQGHIVFVTRTSGDPKSVERAMREIVRGIDGDQPIESIAAMPVVVTGQQEQPLFRTRLLSVFSMIALALAVIGIYGVLAFSVAERTREIGIRMAMGAESGQVVRMLVGQTLLLGATGVTIGAAGSFAATRVIAKFLFGVTPTDPMTFIVTAALLMVVTLLAGVVPARRASSVDPVLALRHE
jgi:putative ABC transport system permease protein